MAEYFGAMLMEAAQWAAIQRRCEKVQISKRVYKIEVKVTATLTETEEIKEEKSYVKANTNKKSRKKEELSEAITSADQKSKALTPGTQS